MTFTSWLAKERLPTPTFEFLILFSCGGRVARPGFRKRTRMLRFREQASAEILRVECSSAFPQWKCGDTCGPLAGHARLYAQTYVFDGCLAGSAPFWTVRFRLHSVPPFWPWKSLSCAVLCVLVCFARYLQMLRPGIQGAPRALWAGVSRLDFFLFAVILRVLVFFWCVVVFL